MASAAPEEALPSRIGSLEQTLLKIEEGRVKRERFGAIMTFVFGVAAAVLGGVIMLHYTRSKQKQWAQEDAYAAQAVAAARRQA